MDRWPKLFTYSIEPGAGKSHFGASLFHSDYVNPERVIYFDNHGSTDALGLPQWNDTDRYGVVHVRSDQPNEIRRMIEEEIVAPADAGEPRFDFVGLDDMSEHAMVVKDVIDEDLDDADNHFAAWQALLNELCGETRLLEPHRTGAGIYMVGYGNWLPDPREKKDMRKGKPDLRTRVLRPDIPGKYGIWLPKFFDIIAFQGYDPGDPDGESEEARHNRYYMLLRPQGSILLKNRWEHLPTEIMPAELEDPSFDKLYKIIEGL